MILSDRRAVPSSHVIARLRIMFPFRGGIAFATLSVTGNVDAASSPAGDMG